MENNKNKDNSTLELETLEKTIVISSNNTNEMKKNFANKQNKTLSYKIKKFFHKILGE